MNREPAKTLTRVLAQSEKVTDLVRESAAELSAVSSVLRDEIANQNLSPALAEALRRSQSVEAKVVDASRQLTTINRALQGEIRNRDMTDHELAAAWEQQAAARHTSLHDALTGLPNRALLDDRLEHGFAQARRHDRSMAVMFLDLDKFKSINDTHGHDVGDFVLKTVAQRLTAVTRGDDTISRISGDEFLYLLTELRSEGNIVPVAEKILKAIRAPMNIQIHGIDTSLSINASIGISIYPQHGTNAGALINSADQAMYRAKQSGAGYALAGQ